MLPRAPKASYDLVLLPGDGIGIEVVAEARALLDVIAPAIGATFQLDEIPCGGKFFLEHGSRDWPEGAEERWDNGQADRVVVLKQGTGKPR